ncbi:MAG TPA: ATP-binding protein [Geothermobacteraceae bacterium]|nr:ATP-binding protein [Geothermobacteraceae bacterium]
MNALLKSATRQTKLRLLILLAIIGVITVGHYQTAIQLHHYHDIFRRLYYLPIILAGLWFQLRGGLTTGIAVSLVYAPHVLFQWGDHPDVQWEQYLEIVLYNVVGVLTGALAKKELLHRQRAEKTASHLDESYHKLKDQAQLILTFEEQLLRASQLSALGELAAGLAHEIRNPLGSIRGTAEIIMDPTTPDRQREEFALILIREVDRLNQVVTDFLKFARPAPVGKQSYDLNKLLDELVDFTATECQRNHVTVDLTTSGLPQVAIDPDQLKQVFLNLILNAVQAMPDGGSLRIRTERRQDSLVAEFCDSGPGIPQDILSKIFNPFFTTRQTGNGLGLAISQRIVQAHGGQIEVENSRQGATFRVLLPMPGNEE